MASAFPKDIEGLSELPRITARPAPTPESLVVLTRDARLLETLQSVAGTHRILPVSAEDQLGMHFLSDQSGVALIDTDAITIPIVQLTARLKSQFPDLVLVVAGNSHDQASLATQIGAGLVYRFLHKPLSEQRIRLFIDAAWRRHGEEHAGIVGLEQTRPVPVIKPKRALDRLRVAGALAVLIVGAVWLGSRDVQRPAPIHTRVIVQKTIEPAGESTSEAVSEAPAPNIDTASIVEPMPAAISPAPTVAAQPDSVPEETRAADKQQQQIARLIDEARKALQASDADESEWWMQAAREAGASEADMDELRREAQHVRLTLRANAITRLSQQFNERLAQNRLVEPANDSAKFFLLQLRQTEADHPFTRLAQQTLAARLVEEARSFVPRRDLAAARRWLAEARDVGASAEGIAAVEREILASLDPVATAGEVAEVRSPVKVHHVDPEYPAEARKLGLSGWVDVALSAQPDGSVTNIAVVRASPPGVFDKAAIAAVRKWRYAPYTQDPQRPGQRTKVRIRFQLE